MSDIVLEPDLDQVMSDLSEWVMYDEDWIGPPENFRAYEFLEDMIEKYETNDFSTSNFTPRQQEAVLNIYQGFDVEDQMATLRYQQHRDWKEKQR